MKTSLTSLKRGIKISILSILFSSALFTDTFAEGINPNTLSNNCDKYRVYLIEFNKTLSQVISEYQKGFITSEDSYSLVSKLSDDINKVKVKLFCDVNNTTDLTVIEASINSKAQARKLRLMFLQEMGLRDY